MHKKINIYLKNPKGFYQYECSTNRSKTCKEAKEKFLNIHYYLDKNQIKACFSKQ